MSSCREKLPISWWPVRYGTFPPLPVAEIRMGLQLTGLMLPCYITLHKHGLSLINTVKETNVSLLLSMHRQDRKTEFSISLNIGRMMIMRFIANVHWRPEKTHAGYLSWHLIPKIQMHQVIPEHKNKQSGKIRDIK